MFHALAFTAAMVVVATPPDLSAQTSARVFARATVQRVEADADLLEQVRRIAAYGAPHTMRVGVATVRAAESERVSPARLPLTGTSAADALWIAERRRRVVTVDFVRN
ncbi:MAG: hypothetical protein R3E98_08695 [Gemmatimonadota bacterium]